MGGSQRVRPAHFFLLLINVFMSKKNMSSCLLV